MKPKTLESAATWLVLAGMVVAMLGLWSLPRDTTIGVGIAALGGLIVAGGVWSLWMRSRITDPAKAAKR